jgi:hypothetical protein
MATAGRAGDEARMSFFYTADDAAARGPAVRGPLQPLLRSLTAELEDVMSKPLYVPAQKALLSREGGRCPKDGSLLEFDPYSPQAHRCPTCGQVYKGELHEQFWIYWYQLWLAERAVVASALGSVAGNAKAEQLALDILDAYSARYPTYPNADNALGPTRPFFSTYIESIWLLQLCLAADLIGSHVESPIIDRFKDAVVEPSVALIRSFDEGLSNRQVWNNAALIAGYRILGREEEAQSVIWAESGLVTHLTSALLSDGMWYEGENYHFFAHRGLWYCMQLASRMDAEIPKELVARYDAGFRAPFLTALPDLTFPSRRDSQYAVSLRQWRFAEMCELGLTRNDDKILRGMLARLYADDLPRTDTGRWRSTAEAERNLPPSRLDRSDLGWKSLLFARPSLELSDPAPLPSVLLDAQGIGVVRRDAGQVYVALDYGVSGGGHGHPDRLNLLVSNGSRRILDDMGTGSYVDPSLHWYRSTLAHNAPMVGGKSQERVDGELIAFEDRGGAGWMSARSDLAFGASATRTVVVMPDYLIDEVAWGVPWQYKHFDLPLHLTVSPGRIPEREPAELSGSDGLEDGFRFLRDAKRLVRLPANTLEELSGPDGSVWLSADCEVELWTAIAPGAPGKKEQAMLILRSYELVGTLRWMWSWAGRSRATSLFPNAVIDSGLERHEHQRVEHGWQVAIHVAGARSTIDLAAQTTVEALDAGRSERGSPQNVLVYGKDWPNHATIVRSLGAANYRRSEDTWAEAGSPTAEVALTRDGNLVALKISVKAERSFVGPGETNRLDNEAADINGAGLQLYLGWGDERAGYVIVPRIGSAETSIRPIDGWGGSVPIETRWRPTEDGYEIEVAFRASEYGFGLDLIINEKPSERERRRGQLVLSGGHGEFIYLRGDRHDHHRLITFSFTDD